MKTTTNDLHYELTRFYQDGDTQVKITARVRLNETGRNGHEDFSATADIWERRPGDRWREASGGCLHDEINKHFPEFRPFVSLHLSDAKGAPMYAVANGFYWLTGCMPEAFPGATLPDQSPGDCRRILREHFRMSGDETAELLAAGILSQAHLSLWLEDKGFRARWKQEADAAIAQLEGWTGDKFESRATRRHWEPLSDQATQDIRERIASGYYSPEQVAVRDAAKCEDARQAKLAKIHERHADRVARADLERQIELFQFHHATGENWIYYGHTNKLACNWTSTRPLVTREAFDRLLAFEGTSELPEGCKLEWRDKPKF